MWCVNTSVLESLSVLTTLLDLHVGAVFCSLSANSHFNFCVISSYVACDGYFKFYPLSFSCKNAFLQHCSPETMEFIFFNFVSCNAPWAPLFRSLLLPLYTTPSSLGGASSVGGLSTLNDYPFSAVSGDKTFDNYYDYAMHRLDLDLTRRQKQRPDLSKEEIFKLMNGLDSDSIAYALWEIENEPKPDTSNIFHYKGQDIDVTKLSEDEIYHYLITVDETPDLLNLEHVRTIFHVTCPNEQLYYPEPFTASPSFIHDDLHFLHILHYQFWLWFVFIFLIIFFFISFLCTVRWCQLRNKPRRETRGVSRSKCGDLITATVPVTWAVSIIVGESTDATDTYDGFATNEILVGIRAYQWGWEYFYPRDINLQHTVKPTYSSFIGKSLKYSYVSDATNQGNNFWKQYQKKDSDQVVTPAYLLVLPVDNHKMFNFLNLNDVGARTSVRSSAFKKIRQNSKTFNTNLVHTPSTFMNRYTTINKLLANETKFLEASSYGLRRQHNLTSSLALSVNNNNFLDSKSLNSFLQHNLKVNGVENHTSLGISPERSLRDNNFTSNSVKALAKDAILGTSLSKSPSSVSSSNLWNHLQKDVETKKDSQQETHALLHLPQSSQKDSLSVKNSEEFLGKLYTQFSSEAEDDASELCSPSRGYNLALLNSTSWGDSTQDASITPLTGGEPTVNLHRPDLATSDSLNYTRLMSGGLSNQVTEVNPHSGEKVIIRGERSIRQSLSDNPLTVDQPHINYTGTYNKVQSAYALQDRTVIGDDMRESARMASTQNVDLNMTIKLLSSSFQLKAPLEPIVSNNPKASLRSFDDANLYSSGTSFNNDPQSPDYGRLVYLTDVEENEVVHLLQGKVEGSFTNLSSAYWRQFWGNSSSDLRVNALLNTSLVDDFFYLPTFGNYYDYDFRNDQALEMLEELFWETSYSSYTHSEYLDVLDTCYKTSVTDPIDSKMLKNYYQGEAKGNLQVGDTAHSFYSKELLSPALKDISTIGRFYSTQIQADDYFVQSPLIATKNFSFVGMGEDLTSVEDSYVDLKHYLALFNAHRHTLLPQLSTILTSQSYLQILNNYRAHYEDFTWYVEGAEGSSEANSSSKALADVSTGPNSARFTDYPSLRIPARNSIVMFSALQKVFRARFDEGRMNASLSHFGDMSVKQPMINAGRLPYENLLGKNRHNFFKPTYYTTSLLQNVNYYGPLFESTRYAFYDFPFLLSEKSELSMYMWFDWYAQFCSIEVQPVVTGKYTIIGVPQIKKYFDFNVDEVSSIQQADSYMMRIGKARHNYLPNWVYTPYLYSRMQSWNKPYPQMLYWFSPLQPRQGKSVTGVLNILANSKWLWTDPFLTSNFSSKFTPSVSPDRAYKKSSFHPMTGIHAYYYHNTLLVDLLTKREFLYRHYFEQNRRVVSLPRSFTVYPQHPLIKELKSSFQFIDPIVYGSASSRETFYNSLSFFKFLLFKEWLLSTALTTKVSTMSQSLPVNSTIINDYLFYYFFDNMKSDKIGRNGNLYKNQFKPLKKGITSMLRLHGTGAVAMPIEMRIRILASSRDIIHSWAVPSAGVKIDCIPGYTSHRIMTFMTPGIYWGQCQEICGRYHHWMPIICYFMKRDLFFLWCTHFVFNESSNRNKSSSRQFNDYIRFASYDKASWLSEIGRQF